MGLDVLAGRSFPVGSHQETVIWEIYRPRVNASLPLYDRRLCDKIFFRHRGYMQHDEPFEEYLIRAATRGGVWGNLDDKLLRVVYGGLGLDFDIVNDMHHKVGTTQVSHQHLYLLDYQGWHSGPTTAGMRRLQKPALVQVIERRKNARKK